MHSLLYQNQSNLTRDRILDFGAQCRLDPEELAVAFSKEASRRKVSREYHSGRSVGIRATLTILMGGRAVPGHQDLVTYARLVEELIQDRPLTLTNSLHFQGGRPTMKQIPERT